MGKHVMLWKCSFFFFFFFKSVFITIFGAYLMAFENFLKEQDSVKNAIVNHYYFLYYSISSNCPRK